MTYFCFVESDILSVPHMEPLAAKTDAAAREEAEILLHEHASGYAAHVSKNDDRVLKIRRPARSSDHCH
jgi:hypothetical protein